MLVLRNNTIVAAVRRFATRGPAHAPKRVSFVPAGNVKLSKNSMTFREALEQDRARADARRGLPLIERIKALPIKEFVIFMVCWSLFGVYVVPYLKSMRPGELPPLPANMNLPPGAQEKLAKAPVLPSVSDVLFGSITSREKK